MVPFSLIYSFIWSIWLYIAHFPLLSLSPPTLLIPPRPPSFMSDAWHWSTVLCRNPPCLAWILTPVWICFPMRTQMPSSSCLGSDTSNWTLQLLSLPPGYGQLPYSAQLNGFRIDLFRKGMDGTGYQEKRERRVVTRFFWLTKSFCSLTKQRREATDYLTVIYKIPKREFFQKYTKWK